MMETKRDSETTRVVFRRWKAANGGTVLALFPYERETRPGDCSSYEHVGQHGAANYLNCIAGTVPAMSNEPDVIELRRELERIGYNLRVIRRASWRLR